MSRNLKLMGLALVVSLALGALVVSAASAKPRLTPVPETYPMTIHANQKSPHKLILPGGRTLRCTTTLWTGEFKNKAEAENGELTVDPAFGGCTAEILGNVDPATVTMNSCDYVFTFDQEATGSIKTEGWEVTGSLHLKCLVPSDKVEIHVYANNADHAAGKSLCTFTLRPQTLSSVDYKLSGPAPSRVDFKTTIKSVSVTRSSGTLANCGAPEQTAELTGEAEAEGFNAAAEAVGFKWDLP